MLTEKNSKILLWIGILLFFGGSFIFMYKESFNLNTKIDSTKIAQFGDFIGGVIGSLWSLAGVILFYVALNEQRKDIKINREALNAQVSALNQQIQEFELQRVELSETREVFQEQNQTLKIQRFENTFFQLINLHHNLVEKLNFIKVGDFSVKTTLEKRGVISEASKDLKEKIKKKNQIQINTDIGWVNKDNLPENKKIAVMRLKKAYTEFYFDDYKQILSHYFRNIYHIFKFIFTTDLIKEHKKQFYASILRAQLSSDELFLILYNSMCENLGYPNFLFLIKEYNIMDNFDFRIMEQNIFHKEIYDLMISQVTPTFNV